MNTHFRSRASFLGTVTAFLILVAPLAAQENVGSLVDEQLSVPNVSALPAPSERVGEYADVNGARIFYQAAGDGPALLLLHGYPLSGAMFGRVRAALEDDWTVITVDHRGYGLSDAPDVPNSIEVYAEDALAVLDHLGIEQAAIGGMSMGGPIALSMYQMAPERFSGMILIDTTAGSAGPPEAGLWRGVETVISENGLAPIMPALIPDMLTGVTRLNEPEYAEYLTDIMQGATDAAGRGGAIALAERPDFTDMLGEIEVPALVMVGIEDALYAVSVSRDMADAIPESTLAILPGGSHAAVFEAAGHAAAAIQDWGETLQ
ncbi:alpha/beta fold hydrolase [Roseovarius sp. D0-M9]|uniref:alpha/beta fold hydrolase n=1 Tax=Roseovarius sp. D0-M9 TaxID=3127117 RepID=UPI00300FFA0B